MKNRITTFLMLALLILPFSGCGALIGAGFRELDDHGKDATYANKSFGGHFIDELAEDDCNRCHRRACCCP